MIYHSREIIYAEYGRADDETIIEQRVCVDINRKALAEAMAAYK